MCAKVFLQLQIVAIIILAAVCNVSCVSDMHWTRAGECLVWSSGQDSLEWEGERFDEIAHGEGIIYILNSNIRSNGHTVSAFYGAIDDNSILSSTDGSKYIGSVEDGQMSGFGVLVKGNEIFEGEFANSLPNGKLKWFVNGILKYEGYWKDGKFDGEGTYYVDGNLKRGHWKDGHLIETNVDLDIPNGHYKGTVLNGRPSGFGIMNYSSGQKYSGTWKEGKWDGKGSFCSSNDTITGFWVGGKLNGNATHISTDYIYRGGFMDGLPDGYGEFVWKKDRFCYNGQWIEGQFCGYGRISFPNGDVYEGELASNKQDGSGRYDFSSIGSYYEGQWKNDLEDGYGLYHSSNFEYIGDWKEGRINGKGKVTYSNRDFYEGEFVNNQKFGYGHYEFSNGNYYDGEFTNDTFNGLGIFHFYDGSVYEGEFQNGKIVGDGTLYIKNGKAVTTITANWDGTNEMPSFASIMFSNGDLYEGPLVNGLPTIEGRWSTLAEREFGKTSNADYIHRANEFYKKHRATIDSVVHKVSMVLAIADVVCNITGTVAMVIPGGQAVGGVLLTTGKVCNVVNNILIGAHAAASTSSAAIDLCESVENETDVKTAEKQLAQELVVDAALVIIPKTLKKIPFGKSLGKMSSVARTGVTPLARSVVKVSKNKAFAKIIGVVRGKSGKVVRVLQRAKTVNAAKRVVKKAKFKSTFLATRIAKSILYKELKAIEEKGPIILSEKELQALLENPKWLRNYIKNYTGSNKNFQEFFIRLSMGNKEQVKAILSNPSINNEVKKRIRHSGEGAVHEWLMTKNFKSFLVDEKWGDDGRFLALALTKLVQKTETVLFKNGGGHVSSSRANTSESVKFHNGLAKVIDSCSSKEELFIEVRKYAKQVLTPKSYKEFNQIFKSIFM